MDQPLITVGVTTYNRPKLLRECVQSILDQEYANVEILIGNDYTPEPVTQESLGTGNDPRIKIVNHRENIGAYQNNYFLLKNARGDWFTWLADDDLMHPKFLQLAYEALSGSDAQSFFSSYAAGADPAGHFPGQPGQHGELTIYEGSDFIGEYASRRIRAVGSYGVFRREILKDIDSVPRFGSGLPVYVDTFIPVVTASLGRVAYRNADLVFLRTHPGSQSANSSVLGDYSSAQMAFLRELNRRFGAMAGFDRWRIDFLWWFVLDAWHVACRASDSIVRRLGAFFNYFRRTLAPFIPDGQRAAFTWRVFTMILTEGARQLGHNALRKKSRPPKK
jgi:glycosyltransferase involved in cell wall biosynthesis